MCHLQQANIDEGQQLFYQFPRFATVQPNILAYAAANPQIVLRVSIAGPDADDQLPIGI